MQKSKAAIMDNPSTRPKRRAVEEFTEDDEILLYHPARDEATVLNQTAAEVWRLCDGGSRLDEITTRLGARHGVEGSLLRDDIAATLAELHSRDLIELH